MPDYFVVTCEPPLHDEFVDFRCDSDVSDKSWHSGRLFAPSSQWDHLKPPNEPIRVKVDPRYSGTYPEWRQNPIPLMTKRIHSAFIEAGVTNLQTFDVLIYDQSKQTENDDYVAFNIVGTIAAADMEKSDFNENLSERLISVDFHSLELDEGKIKDALLFRLAESVNAVIIHERVKKYIESKGIDVLTFIPPDFWGG